MKQERTVWVIDAQIKKLRENLLKGKGNVYALRNLILKLEKEKGELVEQGRLFNWLAK